MKRVVAVHTVHSVYASFPALIRETVPDAEIVNLVDEYLAMEPAAKGEFTVNNLNRLHALLRSGEMAEPDVIVVSCSTLTPPVEILRPLIATPLITIDGAMVRKAVADSSSLTIMATAKSALVATREGVEREAALAGKRIAVAEILSTDAFTALKAGDKNGHDKLVMAEAAKVAGSDVIIIAQASMAHLEDDIAKAAGIPALSGPKLCMRELKAFFS